MGKLPVLKNSLSILALVCFVGACGPRAPEYPLVGVPGSTDMSSVDSLVQGLSFIREHPTEREDERVQRFLWLDLWMKRLSDSQRLTPDLSREFLEDLTSFVAEPPMSLRSLGRISSRAETALGRNVAYYHSYLMTLKTNSVERAMSFLQLIVEDGTSDFYSRARQLLDLQMSQKLSDSRRVGVLIPMRGENASFGKQVASAVQLAAEMAVSEGIEFVFVDSGESEVELLDAFQKLVLEENVTVILGPLGAQESEFVFERAQILRVPVISLSPRENLEMYGSYSFRSSLTIADQVEALASFIRRDLRATGVGMLFPDSRYGWDAAKAAERKFSGRGLRLTDIQVYPENATDFRAALTKMARLDFPRLRADELCSPPGTAAAGAEDSEPFVAREDCVSDIRLLPPLLDFQVLFVPDFADTVGLLLPALPYHRIYGVQVVGLSGANSARLIERGQQHAEGFIFMDGFDARAQDPVTRLFVSRYQGLSGDVPTKLSAEAFDLSLMLVEIFKRIQGPASRDQVAQRIGSVRDFSGVSGKMFAEGQQIRKRARPFIVRDGEIQLFR